MVSSGNAGLLCADNPPYEITVDVQGGAMCNQVVNLQGSTAGQNAKRQI